jgi:hypothetical protein
MEKQRLFEYAILLHPTKKEFEEGKRTEIIKRPETILAVNEDKAVMLANTKIPAEHIEKIDRIEIPVRPF